MTAAPRRRGDSSREVDVAATALEMNERSDRPSSLGTVRRVLFLAPHPLLQERGSPLADLGVLEVLSERGWAVDVLTYQEGRDFDIPGCRIHRIPAIPLVKNVPPGFSVRKLISDAAMAAVMVRLLRRHRYDFIHAVEESVYLAAAAARATGTPYVYDMDSSLAQQLEEQVAAVRPLRPLLESAERFAIRASSGVLAVCRALEELARSSAPHALVSRVEDASLLGSSDGQHERLTDTLGAPGPIVLYVGNLEPYQGIDLLLESFALAAAEVPDARLAIIGGSDGDISAYRARAEELEIADRVGFLGPRPVDALGWFLRQATVLVSPRIRGVNTPMKVFSYLDSGSATLATRLPTHTQVLDDDIAALAEPTSDAFGGALVELLRDEPLRRRLASSARERVSREFTPAARNRKLHAFYDALEAKLADGAVDAKA